MKNEKGLKNLATSKMRLKHIHKIKENNQLKLFEKFDSEIDKQKKLILEFEKMYLDWENIRKIAMENGRHVECAVCMEGLVDSSIYSGGNSRVSLLSCSHVYHEKCLNSWIIYKNGVEECPLCRQSFFTKDFYF